MGVRLSRTKRLRKEILTFLEKNGKSNTSEIMDHINKKYRWGTSINQLGNVLAKDKRFEKVGFYNNSVGDGTRCRVCIWDLSNTYTTQQIQLNNEKSKLSNNICAY